MEILSAYLSRNACKTVNRNLQEPHFMATLLVPFQMDDFMQILCGSLLINDGL